MKKLLAFLFLMISLHIFAASPTFDTFQNPGFIVNQPGNSIMLASGVVTNLAGLVEMITNGVATVEPNIDTAVLAGGTNYPYIYLGSGSFTFTNFITNSLALQGSGALITKITEWTPNTSGSSEAGITIADNDIIRNFEIEPQPSSSTKFQSMFGWQSTALLSPTTPGFNNAIVENIICTNGYADIFLFSGEAASTNFYMNNVYCVGVWDIFVDNNANISGYIRNCVLRGLGPNGFGGSSPSDPPLSHAFVTANTGTGILQCQNDIFEAVNTNAEPVQLNGSAKITFTACSIIGSNPNGGNFTNFFSNVASAGGANYIKLIACDVPLYGIKLRAANPCAFFITPPAITNLPSAGVLQTDGTNSFSTPVSSITRYLTNNLIVAQTSTKVLATYTTPAGVTNAYVIGGGLDITAVVTDSLALNVTWTDHRGSAQSFNLTLVTASVNDNPIQPVSILAAPGTTITVSAVVAGGVSITYDATAYITLP